VNRCALSRFDALSAPSDVRLHPSKVYPYVLLHTCFIRSEHMFFVSSAFRVCFYCTKDSRGSFTTCCTAYSHYSSSGTSVHQQAWSQPCSLRRSTHPPTRLQVSNKHRDAQLRPRVACRTCVAQLFSPIAIIQ